jgi:hypothetical protein
MRGRIACSVDVTAETLADAPPKPRPLVAHSRRAQGIDVTVGGGVTAG